jgi:hypothetical protein
VLYRNITRTGTKKRKEEGGRKEGRQKTLYPPPRQSAHTAPIDA